MTYLPSEYHRPVGSISSHEAAGRYMDSAAETAEILHVTNELLNVTAVFWVLKRDAVTSIFLEQDFHI